MENLNVKIQEKAYGYFMERGMSHGNDIEDWLKAEKEILQDEKKARKPKKNSSPGRQVNFL